MHELHALRRSHSVLCYKRRAETSLSGRGRAPVAVAQLTLAASGRKESEETMAHSATDAVAEAPAIDATDRQFNREQSWLEFNRRVLEEAMDERHPLLERIKFVAIFSSNLDEFFMIRVSGLCAQIEAGVTTRSPDGLLPDEQLAAIREHVAPLLVLQRNLWLRELQPQLRATGVMLYDYAELNAEQRAYCQSYFEQDIFPVLTPLAFDPSHPFPHISNLSLNFAVVVQDADEGELFARVKVPAVLPRLIQLPPALVTGANHTRADQRHGFVWLEQIIREHLGMLFPGETVEQAYLFRVTRNADMEIQEDEADDLLRTIEEGVRQRRFGDVTRLVVERPTPPRLRKLLMDNLKIPAEYTYDVEPPLGLASLMTLMRVPRPDLKDAPFYPAIPAVLRNARRGDELFAAIRERDILLHHPYDSFQPVVDLIESAAADPDVLAIKQTLYRVGSNSPIVRALMRAREEDKQVTVLVELKARFDEENNITWARALESAGVHVVYGVLGLKTHAKVALVVRREHDGLRRYVHLGTGNYNAGTARLYTDLAVFSARPEVGADASELFNYLTGYSRQREYRRLMVAPVTLRTGLVALIEREITYAAAGRPARIVLKCNSLVDEPMTEVLYRASQAGVQIDCIIRGICCLRPGVPGLSENIRVRSIVGRFLEHHRIYAFGNDGHEEIYIGSADIMTRNLDRRVETVFPIEDRTLVQRVREELLHAYLHDNMRARILGPDGIYTRVQPAPGELVIDSQAMFAIGRDRPDA